MAKKRNRPKPAKTAKMTHIGLNTPKFRNTSYTLVKKKLKGSGEYPLTGLQH